MAQEVFLLSRVVRTFGSEERESGRYIGQLAALRRISVRQCAAYLLYLASNASLFHVTKVRAPAVGPVSVHPGAARASCTRRAVLQRCCLSTCPRCMCAAAGPQRRAAVQHQHLCSLAIGVPSCVCACRDLVCRCWR